MKTIRVCTICVFIILLFLGCFIGFISKQSSSFQEDQWNDGYCIEDCGRLHYIGTSNHEIYECEICGKQYKFNKVMSYK